MNRQRLEQLTQEWQRATRLRTALFLLGALLLAGVPLLGWQPFWWLVPLFAGVLFACSVFVLYRLPPALDTAEVARHLDRTFPELEESSALWLRASETLTLPERLQLARLDRAAARLFSASSTEDHPVHPTPGHLRIATWFLLASATAFVLAGWLTAPSPRRAATLPPAAVTSTPVPIPARATTPVWPKILAAELTVTPPAYTGHPARHFAGLDAEVEENATVAWDLTLDQPVRDARLIFGNTPPLPLQPSAEQPTHFRATLPLPEAAFYSLAGTLPDGTAWTPPELHALKVIKDQPPTLRLLQPDQLRTVLPPSSPDPITTTSAVLLPFCLDLGPWTLGLPCSLVIGHWSFSDSSFVIRHSSFVISALASDDYGLTSSRLVATVARGSGEAVKFREQSLPFDSDTPAPPHLLSPISAPNARLLTKTLDLDALSLTPGDELYFYVEARDNRAPAPNVTRSETCFVTIQGPATRPLTQGRGIGGVNLVPQYFRSERQIIMDAEKLLADRPALANADFRARSNDLGTDQALLRLRYGHFLGEDQEDSAVTDHLETNLNPLAGGVPETKPGPRAAASIAERFRQEHEEQAEGATEGSAPRPAPERPLGAEQVRAPYVDEHDSQDAATLFDRQSKGTMREALAAMWQAEGALRTARPADALAPAHRALDILKDLQQSDRAYVQHVGFEAAPLKIPERRLKGDVSGVPALRAAASSPPPSDPGLSSARAALAALTRPPLTLARLEALRRAEPALLAAAARHPDDFLPALQALRQLDINPQIDTLPLQRALLRLLPAVHTLPATAPDPAPSLAASYFQGLQTNKPAPSAGPASPTP